ncbi:hypothetical protein BZA70DRAFT_99896 [Myxozyma melibiosi]|uniref:Uncharacterized protein n=1 Tax=Myxozyma melibiosi TaxID=54550 RepID=A0ABR1EYJ0_9ASCO
MTRIRHVIRAHVSSGHVDYACPSRCGQGSHAPAPSTTAASTMSSSQAQQQQQQQAGSGAQLKRTSSKHFVVGTHHRNASVGKNLNRLNRLEQMTPPQQSPAAQVPPGFIPPHAGLAGQFGVKSQQLAQQADALRKSKSSDALLRRSASGLALTGRKGSRVNLVAGKRTLSALTPAQPKSRRHKHPDKHSKKSGNTSSTTAKGQSDDEEEEEEEEEEDEIGLSIEVPPRRLSTFAGIERDQKASAAFMSEADSELNRVQQRASSTSAPASGSQSLLASPVNSTKQLDPNNKSALLNAVDEAANTIAKDQQKQQQQQQQQADEKTSLSAELRRGMQDPIPTPTQPDGSVDSNPAIRSRFLVDQQASSAGSSRFNPSQPQPSAAHISASQAAARELTVPHSVLSSSADSNSSTWVPTQHAMHPTTDTTQQTQTEQHTQSQATPPTPGPSATAAYSPRPHLITDAEASAAAAAAAAAAVAAVANTDAFPKMPAGASLADIAAAAAASEGSTHAQQRYMFKQHQHESNSASSTSSPGGASRSGEQQTSSSQLSASALLAAAAGGPAAQRELDSLSKELKNVKRYRDPAVEAIERVRVRVMANSVGLGEPIAGAKMVWSFSAVPGRDSTPEQEEKEAIEFVRAGKAVTSEELGRVLMRMWSGKWKLIDESNSNSNSSNSITGGNVPPNTTAGSATPTNARTNATRPQMTMHQSSPHLSRPPTNGAAGPAGAGTRAGPPGSGLPNTAGVRATNLGTVSAGGGVNPLRRM